MELGINRHRIRGFLGVIVVILLPDTTQAQDSGGVDGATIGIAVGVSIATSVITTLLTLTIVYMVMKHSRKKDRGDSSPIQRGVHDRKTGTSINSEGSEVPFIKNTPSRSISQDTEMGTMNGGPRYSRSDSRSIGRPQTSRIIADYVSRWCNENNLSEATVYCLREKGFRTRAEMDSLRVEDIQKLGLKTIAEECKLREAINRKLRGSESQSSMLNGPKAISEDPLPSPTVNDTSAGSSTFDRSTSLTQVDTVDGQIPVGKRLKPRPSIGSMELIDDGIRPKSDVYYINGGSPPAVLSPSRLPRNKSNPRQFKGLLSDKGLYDLAKMIGAECSQLATLLRIPTPKQEQIRMDHPGNTLRQIFEVLRIWRDNCRGTKEQVKGKLHDALQRCNRADLAEDLLQEVVEGSNEDLKYHTII